MFCIAIRTTFTPINHRLLSKYIFSKFTLLFFLYKSSTFRWLLNFALSCCINMSFKNAVCFFQSVRNHFPRCNARPRLLLRFDICYNVTFVLSREGTVLASSSLLAIWKTLFLPKRFLRISEGSQA